jgi:hypothetical protein
MTGPRDQGSEMRSLLLDRDTADRLLSGLVVPDDAPPGYAEVAGLLRSCARLAPLDRAHERATIVAMREIIRSRRPADQPVLGRVAARRPARLKLVTVAVAGMLVGTSGLAFAGELPAPVQRVAHTVFASVGLDVPTPNDEQTSKDRPDGSGGPSAGVGPSAVTKGEVISSIAGRHAGRSGAQGAAVSSEASDGRSKAGQPHGSSDEPHGQSAEPHGQSGQRHGHSDEPHGQSEDPHGQSKEPHGQSDTEHPT